MARRSPALPCAPRSSFSRLAPGSHASSLTAAVALSVALVACSSADEIPNADAGAIGATADAGDAGAAEAAANGDAAAEASSPELIAKGWSWTNLEGSKCDDGTTTGVGIFKTDSPNLLVFLMGGGACWDYESCVSNSLSTHGPYGKTEFAGALSQVDKSVLGTTDASPFATWNKVYVPYCTGDLHTGNHVSTYTNRGRRRLPPIPPPRSHKRRDHGEGSTARIRRHDARRLRVERRRLRRALQLQVDSRSVRDREGVPGRTAPTLTLGESQKEVRPKALASWGSAAVLSDLCATCLDQWADVLPTLATRYANDKFALLSADQDGVMRFFFGLSGPDFKASLSDLMATRYDTQPRAKYWVVTGTRHTFFGDPPKIVTWLNQMTSDDAAWASVKPATP